MPHPHEDHKKGPKEEQWHHGMGGPMKKEFKLAMLEKKEKILKAELEFIGKVREMLAKMPDEKSA